MQTLEVIVDILCQEKVSFLGCFPTTPVIEAAVRRSIRPIICRQERVAVGIADGFARVTNGERLGVFAMQSGPGAENAYLGVATAFSDSTLLLLLPLGHPEDRQGVLPMYSAEKSYASVTKLVERISMPARAGDSMRRAIAALRQGRPGPVAVEISVDVAVQEVDATTVAYRPIKRTIGVTDERDVAAAAQALCLAHQPIAHAGQGVLYAGATTEMVELSELLGLPVMTTLLGKSAFPETHPLSLGPAVSGIRSRAARSPAAGGPDLWRWLQLHPAPPVDAASPGEADHPGDQRFERSQQGLPNRLSLARGCQAGSPPIVRSLPGDRRQGRASSPGSDRRARRAPDPVAGRLAARLHQHGPADQPLPGNWRVHARRAAGRGDCHQRLGQSARPTGDLLSLGETAQIPRLGKIAPWGPALA